MRRLKSRESIVRQVSSSDVDWLAKTREEVMVGTRVGTYLPPRFEAYLSIPKLVDQQRRAIDVCDVLARVLRPYTTSPTDCLFLLHSSWGSLLRDVEGGRYLDVHNGERYLAVAADLSLAGEFPVDPTIWWPRDRAWLVVCVLDTSTVLVGCAEDVASALTRESILVVNSVQREDLVLLTLR